MAMIDEVLGALVIGQWINCFLFCAELLAAYSYFQNYKDHWFLRGIIMFMLANDFTNTILQSVIVYSMSVTNFGDVAKLGAGTVYFSMQCLLPSTTAIICQLFLVWRFFRVTKNYFVSALLCLPPLGAWISAVYATVALLVYTSLEDRLRVVDIGTSWLSLEAASDILISAALIVVLARYTRKTTFSETQNMLRRLILNSITTGGICGTVAIAMLISFLLSKTSNINTGFSFVLGRIYALTLLVNLLIRPKSDSGEATTQNHSGSYGRTTGGRKQIFGVDTFKLGQETVAPADHSKSGMFRSGGIGVSHEIQVQIDQPNSIGEKEGIRGYDESRLERDQYELEQLPVQAKRSQF